MQTKEIIELVRTKLESHTEIVFAYLFGSAVESDSPNDIDIAVYLRNPDLLKTKPLYDIRLSNELEAVIKKPVDVVVINKAPDHLIHQISKGILILNKDDDMRVDFITSSWKKYFEIAPKRREWLKETSN